MKADTKAGSTIRHASDQDGVKQIDGISLDEDHSQDGDPKDSVVERKDNKAQADCLASEDNIVIISETEEDAKTQLDNINKVVTIEPRVTYIMTKT